MKHISMILTIALLLCCLYGCGAASGPEAAEPSGTLYADFSCGSSEGDLFQTYPYAGSLTPEALAGALTEHTGLDFAITASQTEAGWVIDWSAASTLVAGPDEKHLSGEFLFQDTDSLRWFMLDSLWRTLTENLETETIFYTMDGGRDLVFPDLSPVRVFPADIPYLGSPFYFAHSDVRGDDSESPFAPTAGLWRLSAAPDTVYIRMDGMGGFTSYFVDGDMEIIGYLDRVDEYGDGSFRYDMYTMDHQWISGFYFDSPTQIHMGNNDGDVYFLDTGDTPPVLIWPSRFTGLTPLDAEADYQGGYLYRDLTEDSLAVITNCCIPFSREEGETPEDCIARVLSATGSAEPRDLTWTESDAHSQRLSYPVYLASWETGGSEDTRGCTGFFFLTDTHAYLFSFDTPIDHQEQMLDTWNACLETLTLA